MVRVLSSVLMIATGLAGVSGPAVALDVGFPTNIASAPNQCDSSIEQLPANTVGEADPTLQMTKASAIIGGQMSALERIRLEQQGLASAMPPIQASSPAGVHLAVSVGAGERMVPGLGRIGCSRFSLPKATLPSGVGLRSSNDDFLLSRRLPVTRTSFDAEWGRVSEARLSKRSVLGMLPREWRTGRIDVASIQGVNAWVNRRVRYAEDTKLFGRADYWAAAATTLRLKTGDCEDIAIAKLQVLAAMGVPRADMYLTIARDLARHADHALLVVRMNDRFWVLDNAADRLLDASDRLDYQPVLSFSADRKWLHGAVASAAN